MTELEQLEAELAKAKEEYERLQATATDQKMKIAGLQLKMGQMYKDGLKVRTWHKMEYNDNIHLKLCYTKDGAKPALYQYDGPEPCGAAQWDLLCFLEEDELQYILKNWRQLKIHTYKYLDQLIS
jgi:hypothetical protein